jgi:Flp pilus assembly protein TadG
MAERPHDHPPKKAWRLDKAGIAAIEFGLLVPLLVALLLSCAEIGFFVQQTMVVNSAVEAGILVAAKRGFDANAITSAILNNVTTPGLTATPAPSLFCGCAAGNAITPIACDTKCAGNLTAGQYVKLGAALTPQTIMPTAILPLPTTITAQSTIRLN